MTTKLNVITTPEIPEDIADQKRFGMMRGALILSFFGRATSNPTDPRNMGTVSECQFNVDKVGADAIVYYGKDGDESVAYRLLMHNRAPESVTQQPDVPMPEAASPPALPEVVYKALLPSGEAIKQVAREDDQVKGFTNAECEHPFVMAITVIPAAPPVTAIKPDLSEARRLLDAGLHLVKLKRNTKQPEGDGWNKPEARTKSIDPTSTGYGMLLSANNRCSVDPDNWPLAVKGMRALGFDLANLMDSGVRTRSTRIGSGGRSGFTEEPDLSWLTFASRNPEIGTVIEFRAGSPNLQDTVPGLVYYSKDGEVCTQSYANQYRLDEPPPLPENLMAWWQRCSTEIDFLREQQCIFMEAIGASVNLSISTGRKGGKLAYSAPGCRTPFNDKYTVESILDRHDYSFDKKSQRWSPATATGAPSLRPIPGKDGLWQSDHASDPLRGTFDAWTAHVVLDHHGDVEAAKREFDVEFVTDEVDISGILKEISKPMQEVSDVEADDDQINVNLEQPPSSIIFATAGELLCQPLPVAYLIDEIIEHPSLVMLFGAPGTAKSFGAISWSACIAAGYPWLGRDVCQGPVFYLAGEGHAGISRRLKAWEIDTNVSLADAPLYVSRLPAALMDAANALKIEQEINRLSITHGVLPALIVIDTLARNLGNGDENSNSDIGQFVAHIDGMRHRLGCTVLIVHHSGHMEGERARGASALPAAMDATFQMENKGGRRLLTQKKSKESELAKPIFLILKEVQIGWVDAKGREMNSAVIVTDASAGSTAPGSRPLNPSQQNAMQAFFRAVVGCAEGEEIGNEVGIHVDTWRIEFNRTCTSENVEAKKKSFQRVRGELVKRGCLRVENLTYFVQQSEPGLVAIRLVTSLAQAGHGTLQGQSGTDVPVTPLLGGTGRDTHL